MSSEIQFCSECSNVLYPKEDRAHKQLIFLCRSCEYLQYADPNSASQNCVDRLNYNFRSKEDINSYIAQGLGHDPTLPRAPHWKCPKCPHVGAVYFQLPERVADDAMTLVYVCTNCTFYQVKGKETQHRDDEYTTTALKQQSEAFPDEDDQFEDKKLVVDDDTIAVNQVEPKAEEDDDDDDELFGEHEENIDSHKQTKVNFQTKDMKSIEDDDMGNDDWEGFEE